MDIDCEHFAFLLAGHVQFGVRRVNAHSFRFLRHFNFPARLARTEVNNRRAGVVFVCDKHKFPIFADCELFRVRSDVPAIDQLLRRRIDYTKAISGLVRGRAIFIHTGGHSRRTAQCHKEPLTAGRRVNATRPFAYRQSRNDRICSPVNYRYVAGALVADEHEVACGLRLAQAHDHTAHEACNSPETESHS